MIEGWEDSGPSFFDVFLHVNFGGCLRCSGEWFGI